jgi:hypothetical protein
MSRVSRGGMGRSRAGGRAVRAPGGAARSGRIGKGPLRSVRSTPAAATRRRDAVNDSPRRLTVGSARAGAISSGAPARRCSGRAVGDATGRSFRSVPRRSGHARSEDVRLSSRRRNRPGADRAPAPPPAARRPSRRGEQRRHDDRLHSCKEGASAVRHGTETSRHGTETSRPPSDSKHPGHRSPRFGSPAAARKRQHAVERAACKPQVRGQRSRQHSRSRSAPRTRTRRGLDGTGEVWLARRSDIPVQVARTLGPTTAERGGAGRGSVSAGCLPR